MKQAFELITDKTLSGDQPRAVNELVQALQTQKKSHVLLGATGTGKTFTIANVIARTQKKTLIIAHNKTLAGQLYSEMKALFPKNKVEYFISFFDFFQPEAYIPRTDTYIEKTSVSNEIIQMMRLSTLTSLANHQDVIVIASVAAIYPTSSPVDFLNFQLELKVNDPTVLRDQVIQQLVHLQYQRNDVDISAGKFKLRGDVLEIVLGYSDEFIIRVCFDGDLIEDISTIDPLNKSVIAKFDNYIITPANEYIMDHERRSLALSRIEAELKEQANYFAKNNKFLEEQRIVERTNHDLDSMRELGYCSGIENYASHLELRAPGQTPYTLFDFFGQDWLLVIDESHMTVPQIRGMYNTDQSRKRNLVEYGFRLPSALDNRPLNFEEFQKKTHQVVYVSATPNDWEIQQADHAIVEQIVRPTGLVDPIIEVRSSHGQIDDVIDELRKQKKLQERTLITVLTIKMAEQLTELLRQQGIKVAYLHNELKTLERDKVLNDLRRGVYDAIVGINLLREGLDLPEVSLVCIFDANKPGFFRSDKALIQTIGRAARNDHGRVIMYADKDANQEFSQAMNTAIKETKRRRDIQIAYNEKHQIIPKTIIKTIAADLDTSEQKTNFRIPDLKKTRGEKLAQKIAELEAQMQLAADNQEYELAAHIRDVIIELKLNPKRHTKKTPKS